MFNLLDASKVESARDGLLEISQLLHHSTDFKHVLASPVFSLEEKQGVLSKLIQKVESPAILTEFFGQLFKKNRIGFLPEIAEAFEEIVEERRNIQHVWVSSARDISEKEKNEIQTQLGSQLKQDVKVSFETNSNLIAGMEIRIGSRVFDNSVRGKLINMRALLEKG